MNERIKELSSQARDYASEYVADCKRYGYYMEHNEYDLRFEAKFAELIIKECVTTLERHHPFTRNPEAYLYAISLIEYHFGVE